MPQAIAYHTRVANYFKQQQKTWDFFAAANTRKDQLQQFKLDLLKNSYKFDPASDSHIYEKVNLAKEKLGMPQLPVFVYQAQYADEVNASIVFIDGEAHIVFSGKITQLLTDDELLAVLAHELTHIKLYTMMEGDLEIADRIITAIANHHNTEPAYFETARLFRLYTEIFCDRGAYTVTSNTGQIITSLVKIATGLETVNAEAYLKQAEEIFTAEKTIRANTITHPENFIRARAIQLWHDHHEEADKEISKMIEGLINVDALDIFKQQQLTTLTQKFLQLLLKPKWFQTVLTQSQLKQFSKDFKLDEQAVLEEKLVNEISDAHSSIKDYLCYLMIDFILIDPALEIVPFGWAFQFAEDIKLKDAFDAIIKKELKFSDKKLQQHKEKSLTAYYEVKEGANEQVYQD